MFMELRGVGTGLTIGEYNARWGPGAERALIPSKLPWMEYASGVPFFRSTNLPAQLIASWTPIPDAQRATHPGYNRATACYAWGYRPPEKMVSLEDNGPANISAGIPTFLVCAGSYGGSSCPTCPTATQVDVVTPTTPVAAGGDEPGLFGVNVGLLVAAVATGGVGYYGYKKGWFKKLFKRKR